MQSPDTIPRQLSQWQWRYLPNPATPPETEWQPYDVEQNYLIERAYSRDQKEMALGNNDRILSFERMEDNRRKIEIRRVERENRRLLTQEENFQREERFAITEIPKTFNNAFGSITDFLDFFEKRGPEMKAFANAFREIESSNDFEKLNNLILPSLIASIQKEANLNKHLLSKEQQEFLDLFEKKFTSFRDLYGQVFKAYTVDGFLYKNVNKYLRNEDWTSLDNLLPYVFCLCKGFLCSDVLAFCNNNDKNTPQPQELVLYRGTALDKMALELYNPNLTENFSWNAVTSTSTNQRIATNFMYANAEKELTKVPVMFIITIPATVTATPEQSSPNFLKIKPFSAFPIEEEIILPPGSIFHIENVHIDEHERAEIKLRLITDVTKLAHKGQIMHGAMQKEMMIGTEAKIMCLENNDLKEAVVALSGNQLIRELEFCLCKFSFQTIQTIIENLPTIKNLEKLNFVSCHAEGPDQIGSFFKHLEGIKIQTLDIAEINFLDQIYSAFKDGIRYWDTLNSLSLNFTQSKVLSKEWLSQFSTQGVQHLKNLTLLDINFSYCEQIQDEELAILSTEALNYLTNLTSLTLNFAQCKYISNQGISSLAKPLQNMQSLTHLDLNFSLSDGIKDEGILAFCSEGLQHCKNLTSLILNFSWLSLIHDEAITNLCTQGFQHLPNLSHLNIDLACCSSLTEASVSSLAQDGLKFLPKLTTLVLNFTERRDLSDTALTILTTEGLKNITSLEINFYACGDITDEGLLFFTKQGLRNITSLKSLKLNFAECTQFGDDSLEILASEGLRYLIYLTELSLKFHGCLFLGDQGLISLCNSALKYLASLTSLDLNFDLCRAISDEGINTLCTEGLPSLALLTTVNLDFKWCPEISSMGVYQLQQLSQNYKTTITTQKPDEGYDPNKLFIYKRSSSNHFSPKAITDTQPKLYSLWKQISQTKENSLLTILNLQISESFGSLTSLTIDLAWAHSLTDDQILPIFSHGLQPLKNLTSLHLSFLNCRDITDQSLHKLASQGLKNLNKLTSLTLIFDMCQDLTDKGISYLCSGGLQNFTQLSALRLSFLGCWNVTDQGVSELASNCLQNLKALTSLNLCFKNVPQFTTQGMSDLCTQGLKSLINLASLALDFNRCGAAINDEGLEIFAKEALCNLPELQNLNLDFSHCSEISDKGLSVFSQGFSSLKKLTSLNLNFMNCWIITPAGLANLFLQGLKHLENLQSLDLNLNSCQKIDDEGLIFLGKNGLKYLKNLSHLNLNFSGSQLISNEGVIALASEEGLPNLAVLQSLSLGFQYCKLITDDALTVLCSQGLKSLAFLSSLKLDFGYCEGITDEGINNLCFHGLKNLTELRELNFNFSKCPQVTGIAAVNLRKVLKYYGFQV